MKNKVDKYNIGRLKLEGINFFKTVIEIIHSFDVEIWIEYGSLLGYVRHNDLIPWDSEFDLGILICGSGNGISMAANKHQGIRSAICWEPELASLARQHNDANILTMPARFISEEKAIDIVEAFFSVQFEGGRHQNRVNKIACV